MKKRGQKIESLPQMTREIPVEIRRIEASASAEEELQRKAAAASAAEAGEDPKPEDEADPDRFEISISSEFEVERYFGKEILDHSAEAVDLSRAKTGLAFLIDHTSGEQVGIVEGVQLRDDGKLAGILRFSRSARAQEIKRDVQDGIRPYISVGYRILEIVLERSSDEDGDVYRVTRWCPMEVSTVAVPADPTVGSDGRSAGSDVFPVLVRSANETAPKPQLTEVRVNMDPKIAAEIMRLGHAHGMDQDAVAKMVERGLTVDQASREILEAVAKRGSKPLTTPAAEQVQLSEREQKEYRLTRGVMALVHEAEGGKRENCFELEVSDDIDKKTPASVKRHGGLFVPLNLGLNAAIAAVAGRRLAEMGLLSRAAVEAALVTGTANKGKELVFTEPGSFIDFLYNRMLLKAFGAQTISGLQGNIAFPKQTGKARGYWVAENPGADVTGSNATLGQITMSPKTYQSSTAYSRQLLAQSHIDVDQFVRADLSKDQALAFDRAGFVGTGENGEPLGIMNTTGVQDYVLAKDTGNGAAPIWEDIVQMEALLEDVNADQIGSAAWATTPGIKARLKLTPQLENTIALPIWANDGKIDGLQAGVTNQLPKDGTKGDGTNLAPLIHGVFEEIILGIWGTGFEIIVDPFTLKKQGLIELTSFMMGDCGIRQPSAFVVAEHCSKVANQ